MSTHSNMMFTMEKLKKRIQMIEPLRYRDKIELSLFEVKEDLDKEIHPKLPESSIGFRQETTGYEWKGYDRYLWIKFNNIIIPEDFKTKQVLGFFDFGKHVGDGNNEGFESLAYINGEMIQAIDANHQELFFPKETYELSNTLLFRLWSGLTGGHGVKDVLHKVKTAFLCWLDPKIDDLYFTSHAIWETIETLNLHDQSHDSIHLLMTTLDEAILKIDWSLKDMDPSLFYESLHQASNYLRTELEYMEKHSNIQIHAVGHTHIDVAWLWRLKHTREKAIRSFSTVLELMKHYPEYKFMHTTAQVYEKIKTDDPNLYLKIKEAIKRGQWEAEGSMWVEADCNLTSGESLVRQILIGKKFFKDEFDVDTEVLWLPDVFGYSWALPQILKLSNIKTFMTTKISWNEYNHIPHDTFLWKGIDGSEVLTHFITTPWKYQPKENFYSGYNAILAPYTIHGAWRKYQDKDLNQDILISYGFGDGGGGVTRDMLEMRRRLDEIPGLPHIQTSTISRYFKKLHHTVNEKKSYLSKWDGELYFEYHRGTYTTQADVKKNNRKLEIKYRDAEIRSNVAYLESKDFIYPKQALLHGWKILLTNQFHDIIPGSSITEVYQDAKMDYLEADQIASSVLKETLEILLEKPEHYHVFNSSSHSRRDLILIPTSTNLDVYDGDQKLKSQMSQTGLLVYFDELKPLAYTNLLTKPSKLAHRSQVFEHHQDFLITPFFEVKFNAFGEIKSLVDRISKRMISTNEPLNQFQLFEDMPLTYDAWNLDIFYQQKMKKMEKLISSQVVETGELRHVIKQIYTYGKTTITQNIIFYAHTPRIDFDTHVSWHAKKHVLKVAFPVDIRSTKATYDIQFGNVERPTHWNTSWDLARFEVVGHQWADLSEGNYGVSLLNDSKYGYDIKENVLRLTLLRATEYPDPFADLGDHHFTYALYPHQGTWREAETHLEAWYLNNPMIASSNLLSVDKHSLFNLSDTHVWIDAIKHAEEGDDIILRVHEYKGFRKEVTISSDYQIKFYQEVNLLEHELSPCIYEDCIKFDLKPYEIKTFKVKLEKR